MKQIVKNILKAFKQIGQETVEKAGEHTVKTVDSIITGKALLGEITQMNDKQYKEESQKFKNKDEEEMAKLRSQIKEQGRNVEGEMKQVEQEENQKEEDEKKFLENLKRQREQEKAEMAAMGVVEPEGRQARGKMNGGGKKRKKQQPDAAAMSQTQEIKGKVD